MTKQGKNFKKAATAVGESAKSVEDAVALAKKSAFAKFDETVELHITTSADVRHAEQQVREIVSLPHGTGKNVRVLVFAEGSTADAAREAGADYVSDDAIIKQIEDGWADFEVAIAMGVVLMIIALLVNVLLLILGRRSMRRPLIA